MIFISQKKYGDVGWINGGFFLIEPGFFKYIKNDKTYLERDPLEKLTSEKKLGAFKHSGFWKCVDSKRDLENLKREINNF